MHNRSIASQDRIVASRRDPNGFLEEVEFLGHDERIFSCRHIPLGSPVAGVLICSPICADFMANYKREVALGRALASRGIAAQRFHYRGTGNSEGDPAAVTFESLCEDALTVASDFFGRVSVPAGGLLGTRWGALVATAISRDLPGASIALWEPTLDASAYFREAYRARLIRDAKAGRPADRGSGGFSQELDERGVVDLLGYPAYRALYESGQDRTLARTFDARPHPLLLIQITGRKRTTSPYDTLAADLTQAGYELAVHETALAESWWFHTDDVVRFQPLIEATADWFEAQFGRATAS